MTFDDPVPSSLILTPGTYPLSAASGGISGILDTEDNPGATHTYDLVGEILTQTLVPLQSSWSYLDDGSDLGTVWIAPSYDDSLWLVGASELGYGEGDESTAIAGQGVHFTNFFRHRFNVEAGELAEISGLTLRLKRDDGAVVYLNGSEIIRENLPDGLITFDTAASSAPDDGQLFYSFDVDPALLVAGENVLAVEIHQVNLTSSDASFDLELTAETVADDFDNTLFEISGNQLRFAQSGPSLSVSLNDSWEVNIRTTDNGGNSLTEKFTVRAVPDPTQPPTGIVISSDQVGDGLESGTMVGVLSALDLDDGDLHLFELVPGAGSKDNELFEIFGTRLVTREILDANVQASAEVRVRATDRAGFSTESSLQITILDFNTPPTELTFSGLTLNNDALAGTLLGTLETEDPDLGEPHVYTIVSVTRREDLFAFGNEWCFLDDHSDPGGLWRNPSFDDSAWKVGNGSFGYGDNQNTPVDFGGDTANRNTTSYFRRAFSIANPSAYESYEARVLRDDGVAVYLNGVEIGRDNLIAGATASTFAEATIGGVDELTPIVFPIAGENLTAGNQLFAAEVHQVSLTSRDLTFDLALVGVVDASAEDYFEIVNTNEVRTTAAFANAELPAGTLGLKVRTTDPSGDFFEREFTIMVSSDDPDDIDNDRLPDDWEVTYFGGIGVQGGGDDFDGDGSSNLEEFRFDTLPNDPDSKLDFKVIPSDGGFRLEWFSSSRRSYRLQSSLTLEPDSWGNTQNGQRTGTDSVMSEGFVAGGPAKRYFRVVAEEL